MEKHVLDGVFDDAAGSSMDSLVVDVLSLQAFAVLFPYHSVMLYDANVEAAQSHAKFSQAPKSSCFI